MIYQIIIDNEAVGTHETLKAALEQFERLEDEYPLLTVSTDTGEVIEIINYFGAMPKVKALINKIDKPAKIYPVSSKWPDQEMEFYKLIDDYNHYITPDRLLTAFANVVSEQDDLKSATFLGTIWTNTYIDIRLVWEQKYFYTYRIDWS